MSQEISTVQSGLAMLKWNHAIFYPHKSQVNFPLDVWMTFNRIDLVIGLVVSMTAYCLIDIGVL